MIVYHDGYKFESTGRMFNAHGTGHIGLNFHCNPFDVGMGYDQPFLNFTDYDDGDLEDSEAIELADFMIEKWIEYKTQHQ